MGRVPRSKRLRGKSIALLREADILPPGYLPFFLWSCPGAGLAAAAAAACCCAPRAWSIAVTCPSSIFTLLRMGQ